jgi:hypothetical protein
LPSKCPVSAVVAKIADVTIEVVAAPVLALDLARAHALEAEEAEAEAEVETVVTEAIVASTVVIWAIGLEIALNPVLVVASTADLKAILLVNAKKNGASEETVKPVVVAVARDPNPEADLAADPEALHVTAALVAVLKTEVPRETVALNAVPLTATINNKVFRP